jgi:hypothetical protein
MDPALAGRCQQYEERRMTTLPPAVSWESPAPGAFTRQLRFGEWISEPVTPLFESWLLTAMEERTACRLPEVARPTRPAAVPRDRQRLVLLHAQLGHARVIRPQPAEHAVALDPIPAHGRRDQPLQRSAQLPDRGAGVANRPAAAVSRRGGSGRSALRDPRGGRAAGVDRRLADLAGRSFTRSRPWPAPRTRWRPTSHGSTAVS